MYLAAPAPANTLLAQEGLQLAEARFHELRRITAFIPLLLPLAQGSETHYPKICNLDSDSSCLWIFFCKHCSQSAASSGSATAACTVSALTFSDRNDVGEWNFQGHTETDSRNMSKFLRLRETPAEQTVTNLQYIRVLHLGWSSVCFTALVRFIDGHMHRRVLCFFLLPGCSRKCLANIPTSS